MKESLNSGVRLLLITLVAAIALAAVNMVTRGPINQRRLLEENASRIGVMPDADAFEPVDAAVWANGGSYGSMAEAYKAYSGGALLGYTFLSTPQGYGGQVPVTVGILSDGTMVGVEIGDIKETSGIGTRIKEDTFLAQFKNTPAAEAAKADTISGATISSSAVKKAVSEAVSLYEFLNTQGEAIQP